MINILKTIKNFNKQKGVSITELMVVLATASVVVGGVSIKAPDLIDMAKDMQRITNTREISLALELYYVGNQTYPNIAGDSQDERFDELVSQLRDYLTRLPTEKENYDYQNLGSEHYILKVDLINPESPHLENDWDGSIQGVNCDDPSYCIKM